MKAALFAFLALLGFQPFEAQAPVADTSSIPEEEEFKPDPNEMFVLAKLDADGNAIVEGLNRFGLKLYDRLRPGDRDLALSPASISTAFGLAYAGAKGQTAQEIASTLRYPAVTDFHRSFGALLKTMDLHRNGRTLTVNNAIWLQDGMAVRPDYLTLVEHNYGAGLQRVDYKSDSEASRLKINAWVEKKTNNRIRNLLSADDVTSRTRSVLVNTIYFKADWGDPFDEDDTREEDFTLASGKVIRRRLMHQQGDFAFAEGRGAKALAMPYRGGETEMVVLLPDRADGLPALERSLSPETMAQWLAKLEESRHPKVNVTLPKFRIESRYQLVPVLEAMGMRVPLSNASDFSGLKVVDAASADREDWNLKINTVVHQVFVEVEEKGTEAAAATAIGAILVTGMRRDNPPKEFRADHPFMFLIRDRRTKAILFIGRFTGE